MIPLNWKIVQSINQESWKDFFYCSAKTSSMQNIGLSDSLQMGQGKQKFNLVQTAQVSRY